MIEGKIVWDYVEKACESETFEDGDFDDDGNLIEPYYRCGEGCTFLGCESEYEFRCNLDLNNPEDKHHNWMDDCGNSWPVPDPTKCRRGKVTITLFKEDSK